MIIDPAAGVRVLRDSVIYLPDGTPIVNRRPMTLLDPETIADELRRRGLAVELFPGFHDEADRRTVFVAAR